ncbi:hypothetical protein DM02DRAFT_614142 [Periconia macrospinosa]|uniref:VIT-domain-containing protein n=1 Tax=Periconia macrospinosa TaxID=97972 RepID=A0A2V1DRS4_9PLEO|nr:hypothetical protein DM02DRAFT_614142 [Periconia macrospinosa]
MAMHICGCYFHDPTVAQRIYLPQIKVDAHTTIQSLASRTVLKQTFSNPSSDKTIDEIRYAFPLFDGVGVVDFVCTIGERTIYGLVKEKNEAKKTYEKAKERGEQAALLEQLPDAADVFITSISNIAPQSVLDVTITYVQELKHDAEVDGIRFTLPDKVAPRYGAYPGTLIDTVAAEQPDISLTIDIDLPDGIPVKKVMSPSHPIELSLGSLSTSGSDDQSSVSKASATLALGTTPFQKEFVLQVVANDIGIPHAVLETHPTLPNQRALLATLVPKFSLKHQKPEILFLADRSGSMYDNIDTLIAALKNFLKSIPPGCNFNVISFGSNCSSLWPTSQLYTQSTLDEAIEHVEAFDANFGGTETLSAIKNCLSSRRTDVSTELILLTDGDIWQQQQAFDYIADATKNQDIRIFPIGIGGGVSSALIEGIARAGNGFGQMIGNAEKMTSKVVRMLKAALMPHIKDYRLEIKYEDGSIGDVADNTKFFLELGEKKADTPQADAKPISLYNANDKEEQLKSDNESEDVFKGVPEYHPPKTLQTPYRIPQLYPFHRTCVYLLMGPETSRLSPKSVILKGMSPQGPLEIEIPIKVRKEPDQMIHQLAARKATQELEEGRGWVTDAKVDSAEGKLLREDQPILYRQLLKKEAVRLGVKFQVGGKHCSFVAVEANEAEIAEKRMKAIKAVDIEDSDWDVLTDVNAEELSETETLASQEQRVQFEPQPSSALSADENGIFMSLTNAGSPMATAAQAHTLVFEMRIDDSLDTFDFESFIRVGGEGADTAFNLESLIDFGDEGADNALNFESEMSKDSEDGGGANRFLRACESESDKNESWTIPESFSTSLAYSPTSPQKEGTVSFEQHVGQKPAAPLLVRLIDRQAFDGSWPGFDSIPCDEMGLKLNDVEGIAGKLMSMASQKVDKTLIKALVSTVLAVLYMEKKMADEEETWELVVEKARTFAEEVELKVGKDVVDECWKLSQGLM